MGTKSISRQLAGFINRLSFTDLPSEVVDFTKSLILDNLSTAIAAFGMNYTKMALELARGSKGKATLFGCGLKASAMDAALVNAVTINTLGQDDMLYLLHAGQIVLPSAIAIAEEQGSSGADVITALVAGYDAIARTYLVAPSIVPKFRGVPAFGPFGAAAASGKLLKLNEDRLTSAIGYAANWASGLSECWVAGTMEAKFHCGVAARNGITAALLARAGATAAETSLEGKAGFYQAFYGKIEGLDMSIATKDLGKKFYITEATYKPYPVCGTNQVPVDLALSLVKKHNIKGKDVAGVVETMPAWAASYPGIDNPGPVTTRFQAQMSSRFCVASALLGKPIASFAYVEKNFSDPEAAEMAKRIKIVGEENRTTDKIEVTLKDGRKVSAEGPAGEIVPSPVLVPTLEKVRAKFDNLTSGIIDKDKRERIIDIVLNLEKAASIRRLTRELM